MALTFLFLFLPVALFFSFQLAPTIRGARRTKLRGWNHLPLRLQVSRTRGSATFHTYARQRKRYPHQPHPQ